MPQRRCVHLKSYHAQKRIISSPEVNCFIMTIRESEGGDMFGFPFMIRVRRVAKGHSLLRDRRRKMTREQFEARMKHVILPESWTGSYVKEAEGFERGEHKTYEYANRAPRERINRQTTPPAA
jgi:hypothetical protein